MAIPTGTLTKKIHGQESRSTRIPPSSRPTAPPPVAMPLHTPSAFVRSAPSAKVVVTIESAAGAIERGAEALQAAREDQERRRGASPFSSDATVKMTTPARKTRLRPIRSPARPPRSRKPPKIERVRVDHPLQVRLRHVQVRLDRRQRDVHHRRVENDHELREADEAENEPGIRVASGTPVFYRFGTACSVRLPDARREPGEEAEAAELDPGGAPEDARRLGRVLPRLRAHAPLLRGARGGAAGGLPAVRRRAAPPLPRLRRALPVGVRGRVRGVRRRGAPPSSSAAIRKPGR